VGGKKGGQWVRRKTPVTAYLKRGRKERVSPAGNKQREKTRTGTKRG